MLSNIMNWWKSHPEWWGRILLTIVGMVGYGLTVAPTVSFWDCGEFIAAAHVVGIPHPPGTPFFVILGKAWSLLLSFAGSVAFRINLLSAFSSLIGVLFIQEIASEVLRHFRIPQIGRVALAFLAGSLVAFSDTYWFNAVEAEVYGVSMALLCISIWVLLRWDRASFEHRNRWLTFFVYLSFLGLGVHTNAMLAFLPGWLFIGIRSGYCTPKRYLWILIGILVALPVLLLQCPLLYGSSAFLGFVGIFVLSLLIIAYRKGEWSQAPFWILGLFLFSVVFVTGPFLVGLGVALVFSGICAMVYRKIPANSSLSCGSLFLLLLVAALGYSTQLVLPVRSSTNPVLDENNPESWEEVRDALERKQYGSMGMLERALWRRAAWESQLGFSDRIGYLGYHLNQFAPAPMGSQLPLKWEHAGDGLPGYLQIAHRLVGELLLVLVLVAAVSLWRRPQVVLVASLFFATSLGLMFYVNFSDGSKPDSRDASSWHQRIEELKQAVQDPGLAPLPSLEVMASSIEAYRSSGKVTEEIRNLMAWEKAATAKGMHLPMPPRNVHREVRERDYFYTPAFALFPILLAFALALLWETKTSLWLGRTILGVSAVAWLLPFLTHFETHNRSHDWVARNFARNILASVPPNGILMTFGDNDTFPLWYIQMVEEFRTDVQVVNGSLVQMGWYQDQLLQARPDLKVLTTTAERAAKAYQVQVSPQIRIGETQVFLGGDSLWRPGPGDQLMAEIVALNWPRVPMSYMYNANPRELPGGENQGDQFAPVAGLVRVLGMAPQQADSLMVQRIAHLYDYGGFETPHWRFQESTSRTAMGYRYMLRAAESLATNGEDRLAIQKRRLLLE